MKILVPILIFTIMVTLHELGHVLGAKLVGAKIHKVGLNWTGPYIEVVIIPPHRGKAITTLLGGPVLNLLCFPLMYSNILEFYLLGCINVFCGVGNLLLPKSDGSQIYKLLRDIYESSDL